MHRSAALPFFLRRSQDIIGSSEITTITETVHGLLHLEGDRITIQWRLSRKKQLIGSEIRTDEEAEAVREVVIPLSAVAGATTRRGWLGMGGTKVVLTASDLRAFEELSREGGLRLSHPAELVVRIRRDHRLAAEEFTAELALARAELTLGAGAEKQLPPEGSPGEPEAPPTRRP
jgi:hypothetical protein